MLSRVSGCYHLLESWPDRTGRTQIYVGETSLLPIGLSSKVAAFSSISGLQGALSMGCFHTGILLFQPTFLTAPWFGWRVHCQLCDPLRNTVYRSVVVASGFGMFNRSFHWVPQMNLFWNILDRGKKDKLEPCWDNDKSHWYCTTPWILHLNQKHVTTVFQNLLVCLKLERMVNICFCQDFVLLGSSPDLHIGK